MKILFTFFVFFSCLTDVYSQKVSKELISEYEDTLKFMAQIIMNGENDSVKQKANDGFIITLKDVLQYERSFNYPFDSLKTISVETSSDKKIKIYSWFLRKDNGNYNYFAFVHHYNKAKKRFEVIELIDNSEEIRRAENKLLDNTNWFGALYYKIIYIKKKGRKYYTLLGWDGNNDVSTKKIIDVMYIAGKGQIRFGAPIFKKDKLTSNRMILEYHKSSAITVRYQEKNKSIVFDHLIPMRKDLEGLHEYYVPNGTYDAIKYSNDKWIFTSDVNVNNPNSSSTPKIGNPKMGITPE